MRGGAGAWVGAAADPVWVMVADVAAAGGVIVSERSGAAATMAGTSEPVAAAAKGAGADAVAKSSAAHAIRVRAVCCGRDSPGRSGAWTLRTAAISSMSRQ